jgi:hypothetical protein
MYKPMFTNAVCLPVYRYNSTFTDDDGTSVQQRGLPQAARRLSMCSPIRRYGRVYRDPVSTSAGQARKLAALCQLFKASEMRVRTHVCWRWVMAMVICMSGGLAADAGAARDDVVHRTDASIRNAILGAMISPRVVPSVFLSTDREPGTIRR